MAQQQQQPQLHNNNNNNHTDQLLIQALAHEFENLVLSNCSHPDHCFHQDPGVNASWVVKNHDLDAEVMNLDDGGLGLREKHEYEVVVGDGGEVGGGKGGVFMVDEGDGEVGFSGKDQYEVVVGVNDDFKVKDAYADVGLSEKHEYDDIKVKEADAEVGLKEKHEYEVVVGSDDNIKVNEGDGVVGLSGKDQYEVVVGDDDDDNIKVNEGDGEVGVGLSGKHEYEVVVGDVSSYSVFSGDNEVKEVDGDMGLSGKHQYEVVVGDDGCNRDVGGYSVGTSGGGGGGYDDIKVKEAEVGLREKHEYEVVVGDGGCNRDVGGYSVVTGDDDGIKVKEADGEVGLSEKHEYEVVVGDVGGYLVGTGDVDIEVKEADDEVVVGAVGGYSVGTGGADDDIEVKEAEAEVGLDGKHEYEVVVGDGGYENVEELENVAVQGWGDGSVTDGDDCRWTSGGYDDVGLSGKHEDKRMVGDGGYENVEELENVAVQGWGDGSVTDGDDSRWISGCYDDVGLSGKHKDDVMVGDGGYEHVEELEDGDRERWGDGSVTDRDEGRWRTGNDYPLRPDAEDCSYYMRTGMCKYGATCRFNHPLRRKYQPFNEMHRQKEENVDMHGQTECKYYLSPAGCKYGKSCKFSHSGGKSVVTPVVEFNFLGLPIRPGEKECPYYMRNGSCKYGPSCRFNHPDPSAVGGDSPTTFGNDKPPPLQPRNQPNIPNMPSWTGSRTPDPPAAFAPVMYPSSQNMPPPNQDWKGYQAPSPAPANVYPSSERGLPIPPAFFLNNPPTDANMYKHQQQPMGISEYPERQTHHQQPMTVSEYPERQTHHQQPMTNSEYPERPGQPECSYFMKTGDCKYRVSCKFHHPKSRIPRSSPSALSDKGLPLRPDQNICTYYSRYGICKYGPACKFDHPVNYNINSIRTGQGYDGSNRGRPLIQQSV